MAIDVQRVGRMIESAYGLSDVVCRDLGTPANDALHVSDSSREYAFKIYNPASRSAAEVQWEVDLTVYLAGRGAPVASPIATLDETFCAALAVDGADRVGVLFEWAPGSKPAPDASTFELLGKVAAQIHNAADGFVSSLPRERYDLSELVDDQLVRLRSSLESIGRWDEVNELADRVRSVLADPLLDFGVIHNDLTLDNVHVHNGVMTVFDLDSAGECWRASEPWRVVKHHPEHLDSWLDGYQSHRAINQRDLSIIPVFGLVQDFRNVAWNLGLAKSSRGAPSLNLDDLGGIVDAWLN